MANERTLFMKMFNGEFNYENVLKLKELTENMLADAPSEGDCDGEVEDFVEEIANMHNESINFLETVFRG